MTSSKELEALARRFMSAMDAHDWDRLQELTSPHLRSRVGGNDLDRETWLGMGRMFLTAFSDSTHEIEDLIVAGEQVIVRHVWRATHTGDFQGIPATGRRIALNEIVMERWVDGRMTEHFAQFDSLGLMQQLGVIPGATAA